MSRLVMMYWDCPYCDSHHIKGTDRECPSCGHPRGTSTSFYMDPNHKEYLTEEQAQTKGKGADWLCPACDCLNSVLDNTCKSCGASKGASKADYFAMRQQASAREGAPW